MGAGVKERAIMDFMVTGAKRVANQGFHGC
jgi:hypothetical protein